MSLFKEPMHPPTQVGDMVASVVVGKPLVALCLVALLLSTSADGAICGLPPLLTGMIWICACRWHAMGQGAGLQRERAGGPPVDGRACIELNHLTLSPKT